MELQSQCHQNQSRKQEDQENLEATEKYFKEKDISCADYHEQLTQKQLNAGFVGVSLWSCVFFDMEVSD